MLTAGLAAPIIGHCDHDVVARQTDRGGPTVTTARAAQKFRVDDRRQFAGKRPVRHTPVFRRATNFNVRALLIFAECLECAELVRRRWRSFEKTVVVS